MLKGWKNGEIRIALYGLENQTVIDPDMPLRVIGYDGAADREQISIGGKPEQSQCPVVTLVLYFGSAHWKTPLSLRECLEIPEELDGYVNDYPIHVFEIAYLDEK